MSTQFGYDDWKPVTEYDSAGNLAARNIYGPGPDEILMRGSGYGWFFYHSDKQGSVSALVDLSGNVVEKYNYDAFGRPTITDQWGNPHYDASSRYASWYGNRFMFTGREWFPELHVYDYRRRLYNPDNGRFLQTDPVGLQTEGAKLTPEQRALFSPGGTAPEAFSSSELNLYRYCGDDPINHTDPFGLELLGDNVPFERVDFVTIPGGEKYGGIQWKLSPNIVTQAVPGGYTASVQGLNVIIQKAQIATKVQVKGEARPRNRTEDQIAATLKHEKMLHKEIGRSFDKENRKREFPKVHPDAESAKSNAADQLKNDFQKAQKHDDKFNDVMRRESFR